MNAMENAAPRLLFPGLKPFYVRVEPLTWPLIRITAGLMLLPHGWPKLMMGIDATAQMALVKRGIQPAEPLAVILITIETAVIVYHHLPKFGWTGPGYEYPLFWGIVMFVIALRGGGAYSLDRRIGREL